MKSLYVNENRAVFIDSEERFIYEVIVYIWFDGTLSQANSKMFVSKNEIKNIIQSYFVNKYIEYYTYLYAAPKTWLIDNDFIPYVKFEKKKRIKKKKDENSLIIKDSDGKSNQC